MKGLHPYVIFIADQPSTKNKSQDMPLVGTKSYRTLLNWIADMDVDVTNIAIYNQSDKPFSYGRPVSFHKIIALGKNASAYLKNKNIKYFELPHPSGRNRKLNDKKYVKQMLKQCRDYIYDM